MTLRAKTLSRAFLTLLLSAALAAAAGCASMQKDIEANTARMNLIEARNAELANRIDAMEKRMDVAESTVDSLDDEVTGEGGLAQACKDCTDQSKRIEKIARTQSFAYRKKQLLLKVKVLAGDEDLTKARRAARRLEKNGYSVRVVDITPEPKFKHVTIYYATGFKDEARLISKVLGKRSTLQPLTWNSVFDIIVVTSGN
jgi:septal ring factor EnvC (AmiA/AmiB activator)